MRSSTRIVVLASRITAPRPSRSSAQTQDLLLATRWCESLETAWTQAPSIVASLTRLLCGNAGQRKFFVHSIDLCPAQDVL